MIRGKTFRPPFNHNRSQMIQDVAALMDAFRIKEAAALDRYDIQHPGLIGNMYEGLTKYLLVQSTIFSGLDLNVVDGKIKGADGTQGDQIDCMLVEGVGERIPYTESFVYPIERVISVIEVKKNLYSNELRDAYSNLKSVSDLKGKTTPDLGLARSAFRAIALQDVAADDFSTLSSELRMLFDCLVKDSTTPIRIVMGYFGFATEHSLRTGMVKYLRDLMSTAVNEGDGIVRGFGPKSFPNLILCRDSALLKLNGMPYSTPIVNQLANAPQNHQDGWWPFYMSMQGKNGHAFLETIWTRLRSRYQLASSIFGDDLEIDCGTPLLFAKAVSEQGWAFQTHEETKDNLVTKTADWAPVIVTEVQSQALLLLALNGRIDIDSDDQFGKIAEDGQVNKEALAKELEGTMLVFVDSKGVLRFLTERCDVVFLTDGRIAAGDNVTGRLTRWAMNQPSNLQF